MLNGVWANIPSNFYIGTPYWGSARTGAYCLALETNTGTGSVVPAATIVVPGAPAICFVSFGFAVDNLPVSGGFQRMLEFRTTGNATEYYLSHNPTGTVSLYNSSGTIVATTASPVIRSQTWHFIEAEINFTAGTFTLRVDDSSASLTPAMVATIGTGSTVGFVAFSWQNGGGSGGMYWDDLFIRDSNGTVNNGFLGDRKIGFLPVDADTTTAGWSPTFYQKFGAGTARFAYLIPNSVAPINQNAFITLPSATSFDVGTADFTIESFVRFEQLPSPTNYATIFSRWDQAGNNRSYRLILGGTSFNSGSLQFDYSTGGTAGTVTTAIQYPFTPVLNQWYHIAIVRASNELLLFVNGSQLGVPISSTTSYYGGGPELFSLGAECGYAGYGNYNGVVSGTYLTGMYDETRFTNGYARYTSTFTPPSAPFPRGAGSDTYWSDVVFIAGYDSALADESSFTRPVTAYNGATQFLVNDGTSIGTFSTIDKSIPDDNTFIAASFLPATGILTMTTQPANGNTVTVGTTNGTTAAVYTFKTAISSAYDVLIDTTAQNTLTNLVNAINLGTGIGTKYGNGTLANYNVSAALLPAGQMQVTALVAGTTGNSIATSATGTAASWGGTTLSGGTNIPGPSAFSITRPPPNTTLISALQIVSRAYKSDSGGCDIQNALVGALGGSTNGTNHAVSTNAGYYNDVFETDPDTSSSITPATIIGGAKVSTLGVYIAYGPPEAHYAQLPQLGAIIAETAGNTNVTGRVSQAAALIAYATATPTSPRTNAWTFVLDGHRFYVLPLGLEGDWMYDTTTKEWSQIQTQGFSGLNFTHGVMWDQRIMGGDSLYPVLLEIDPNQGLDDGFRPVEHVVTGGLAMRGRNSVGVANFTLTASVADEQSAANSSMSLAFSDDNGVTYSEEFALPLTDMSSQQLIWNALGSFSAPGRVFRITDYSGQYVSMELIVC
ncbi:unnamed protein product [Sphagnum jensenii]